MMPLLCLSRLNNMTSEMASVLDLAAPTCTETVETPLPLQECESDSESDSMVPQDYSVGDLVWAAIPTYPYWPAMITRDPVTSLPYKVTGTGNTSRTLWHVHFFGDKGMRGWVVTRNTLVFDGLESYNNAKAEFLSSTLIKMGKKKKKIMAKAFTVPDHYSKSWASAVSESQSLLASSRSDRLEYLISTYAPKIETLKKRQRSLSLCDLSSISKKQRTSEPPKRRNSVAPKTVKQKSTAEPIKPLGISARPKTVVRAIPTKVPKCPETSPPISTSMGLEVPNSPARDHLLVGPDSALVASDKSPSVTPKRSTPKAVNTKSAQPTPPSTPSLKARLPLDEFEGSLGEKQHVEAENLSTQSVPGTSVLPEDVRDSLIVSLESGSKPTTPEMMRRGRGRPRKTSTKINCLSTKKSLKKPSPPVTTLPDQDSTLVSREGVSNSAGHGQVMKESPKNCQIRVKTESVSMKSPKKSPRAAIRKTSIPAQAVPEVPVKRPRGRPRKISLPTPGELENPNATPKRTKSQGRRSMPDPSSAGATPTILCAMGPEETVHVGVTPDKAKSQSRKKISPSASAVPTITRSGRQSKKPVALPMFTSPKPGKHELKNMNNASQLTVSAEQVLVDLALVKIEPESQPVTPTSKRKRLSEKLRKKKIKLEPDGECPVEVSIVKEEQELGKPPIKTETAAKAPKESQGSPRIPVTKKISLFAGIKDGKLCSICFKAGEIVRRCRGPCSLYMHEECSKKPRYVPDCDPAQDAQRKKKRTRKQIVVDGTENGMEKSKEDSSNDVPYSSNGSDSTPSDHDRSSMEMKQVNGLNEDSISAVDSALDNVQMQESTENEIRDDSRLLNGPTGSEKLLLNPAKTVETESLNGICRLNGKRADESNVEEAELVIHMSEPESFPDSSGIPTPPPEDNVKSPESPKSNGGQSLKLGQVVDDLAIVEIGAEQGNFPIDSAESMTSDASEKDKNDTSKKYAKDKGWVCNMCQEGNLGPCFSCGKDDGERVRCKTGMCGKVFHLECTKDWPQHTKKHTATGKLIFHCPAHTCHTCISDNPASLTSRYVNDKLVRCVRCPTTYHHGNFCVPAGSEILSSTQIICPRHFRQGKKSLGPVNASWCFLCSMGGSLICCDLCPNSFHVECLNISPPEGAYICEDCETGRFPLYGEIVWAKLGNYRWWPARILFPLEIPASLQRVDHVPGEFVVRFYGTYNYYWLHRGRVFLFHDGDGKKQESISLHSKKHSDGVFNRGVEEANKDFAIWTGERNRREETQRTSMKPPKYVKISSNRPVGSVKMNEADVSSLTACDCKPEEEDPCGPDSDCINRLLLVECSPHICPAGEKCNNKNFEKRLYPPLAPFRTEYRGWGLKTLGPLKKGDFIIEYVGEMIDEDEYKRRLLEMQRSKDENFYFLTLDKDRMLDAGPKGNLSRFMNHSCQPNCETQKWTVEGNTRVGLFALQEIPADTELVFNYNLMTTGDNKIECRCGAPNCAGFIGGKPNKQPSKPKDDSSIKLGNTRQRAKKKRRTRKKNLTKVALTNSSAIGTSSKVPSTKEEMKCYACHEIGATVACQDASCPQMYHLACLGLTKDPSKKWTCPWHECSVCGSRNKVVNCSLCINAYCSEHQEGNIVLNRGKGSLCHNHNMSDSGSEWSTGEKEDETVECRVNQTETKAPSRR
uniref:Histone-lysine N-methyltransferase, H3 lysine-36 and H4 lysine-20 specific n=1 Tax=Lygus hesperus TaxID=30085 RepID=A0A146LNJ8_LYGHE